MPGRQEAMQPQPRNVQELGEGRKEGPLEPLEEMGSCPQLCFGTLATRDARIIVSV